MQTQTGGQGAVRAFLRGSGEIKKRLQSAALEVLASVPLDDANVEHS